MNVDQLVVRRNQVLGSGARLFYSAPLHIVRGEGVHLFDEEGRRYVDMYNNVPCVGHGNERVADAIARQQRTLNVHSRYLHEGVIEFAERLVDLHPPHIQSVIFSCSGTEANEVALRMARIVTAKRGFICTNAAYHGSSELVGVVSPLGRRGALSAEVRTFPFPETYRLRTREGEDPADVYLERLRTAIRELQEAGIGFAALILCPLLANEGLPDPPPGFFVRASKIVHDAGGLIISDEVQAGYGRSGHWWAYENTGLAADIVVSGKPMGNGVPLAATFASRHLVELFRKRTRYFNTFAASPLQAAAGSAVLDVIMDERLFENAAEVGAALKTQLRNRMRRWRRIGDVRGTGLFLGVEFVVDDANREPDIAGAVEIVEQLKTAGFLTSNAGAYGNVLKIRPPLPFTHEHAEAFLTAFDAAMATLHG